VSFDANPQGAHESVEDIGKNLVHSLVNEWVRLFPLRFPLTPPPSQLCQGMSP
jgi:hypothetical protein